MNYNNFASSYIDYLCYQFRQERMKPTAQNNIKTHLKFSRTEDGALVGFVTISTTNGYIRGVRENSRLPKQICIVPDYCKPLIKEGVVYDVELRKVSKEANWFMVIDASEHLYKPDVRFDIDFQCKRARIECRIGNKLYVYDKFSKDKETKDFKRFITSIESYQNLKYRDLYINSIYECYERILRIAKEERRLRRQILQSIKAQTSKKA